MTSDRQFINPPVWDDETLDSRRRAAIEDFIKERAAEGNRPYQEAFARSVGAVQELFERTQDLARFGSGEALASNPSLTRVARYLAGPPVSADDLNTLAGAALASRKRLDAELASRAATVLDAVLDRARFPWLFAEPARSPAAAERELAVRWTAGLLAIQEVQTGRRGESATRQEQAVEALLESLRFIKVKPRTVSLADDLSRGEFCRETLVAGTKCDVPVRLRDGRLLLIE
jgi:hypothetical protein